MSKRKKPMKPLISLGFYGVYSVDALEIFCLASSVLTVFTGLFLLRIYRRRGPFGGSNRYAAGNEYRTWRELKHRTCQQSKGHAVPAGNNGPDGDGTAPPRDPEADCVCP